MKHPAILQSSAIFAALAFAFSVSAMQASAASAEPDAGAGDAAALAVGDDEGAGDSILHAAYDCEDGATLEVVTVNTADGNSYAIIEHDGHLVPMELAVSASGARWLSVDPEAGLELWEHQGTISLDKGDTAIVTECPARAEQE